MKLVIKIVDDKFLKVFEFVIIFITKVVRLYLYF